MKTLVWNPADETLVVNISIDEMNVVETRILPGDYVWIENVVNGNQESHRIDLEGDRRLVILETRFE